MKLLVLYMLACFLVGAIGWRTPARRRVGLLIGLCVFVCIGYFFLRQV